MSVSLTLNIVLGEGGVFCSCSCRYGVPPITFAVKNLSRFLYRIAELLSLLVFSICWCWCTSYMIHMFVKMTLSSVGWPDVPVYPGQSFVSCPHRVVQKTLICHSFVQVLSQLSCFFGRSDPQRKKFGIQISDFGPCQCEFCSVNKIWCISIGCYNHISTMIVY